MGYALNGVATSRTRFGYSLTRSNNWPISRLVFGSTYSPTDYIDYPIPQDNNDTDVSVDVVISDQYMKTSKYFNSNQIILFFNLLSLINSIYLETTDEDTIYDCIDLNNLVLSSCYEPNTQNNDDVIDPIDGACCENTLNNTAVCCQVRVMTDSSKAIIIK